MKTNTWLEQAYSLFTEWLKQKPTDFSFMMEDFREYSSNKIETPMSNRIYGSVSKRAKKDGLIKSVGKATVSNPTAHKANAEVWIKQT